jgi:uncharacterized paraquat-inducible protein A
LSSPKSTSRRVPVTKLVMLLELSLLKLLHRRHKAWTYRLTEQLGRWSMMDVLLLAFLARPAHIKGIGL